MDKFAVVSYLPFFVGKTVEEVVSHLQKLPQEIGTAKACIWSIDNLFDDNEQLIVTLSLEFGNELYDHVKEWSGNEISLRWGFQLHTYPDGRYGFLLGPNFNQSILRAKLAIGLQSGVVIPNNLHNEVLFRPFTFISEGPSRVFNEIQHLIKDTLIVRFLDSEDFEDFIDGHEDSLCHSLGEISRTSEFTQYMESMGEDGTLLGTLLTMDPQSGLDPHSF